jgi:hypothetical protein
MLKLALEDRNEGGALIVLDAPTGNVCLASASDAESGWKIIDPLSLDHVDGKMGFFDVALTFMPICAHPSRTYLFKGLLF